MVDVNKAVLARLKKEGIAFEILVDCDKALEYREGKSISLYDVVATDHIFKDVKKAEKSPEADLLRIFKTKDPMKIAEIIIREGEVQLTAAHRDKLREDKKKRIINIIHRNAIDSRTGLPHPPQRIEAAMQEAKVHIDDMKRAEEQVDDIITKLRVIIPIKLETREIAVKIPPQYAGGSFHILKKYKVLKEEWQNDGSLVAVVEIPAGIQDELFSELNKATHGEVESKIVGTK